VVHERDGGAGLALAERHPQRVEDQRGAHVAGELPADDPAAVGVDDEREEHHALPAPQVGQVGHPQLVRPARAEVALDEIGPAARFGVGPRGPPRPPTPLRADDPVRAHQPLHTAARHALAGPQQRLPHPPVAVGVVVSRVELADPTEQPLILYGSLRALSGRSLVVGGRRHVHDPADRLDTKAAAMLVDEAAHFGRSVSSSVAKNTDAALRISFARRSS
jgi:hypothetical protein